MPDKNLEHYTALPYRVDLYFDRDDGVWIARYPELPGCVAHGGTKEEALAAGENVKSLWLETALEHGDAIPLPQEETVDLERKFLRLAEQWRRDTRYLSSASKICMHPAYQQIIGMGPAALPFIFRDLQRTQGHWGWALFAITGEVPAPEGSTYLEAVDAWLAWGRSHGYLSRERE